MPTCTRIARTPLNMLFVYSNMYMRHRTIPRRTFHNIHLYRCACECVAARFTHVFVQHNSNTLHIPHISTSPYDVVYVFAFVFSRLLSRLQKPNQLYVLITHHLHTPYVFVCARFFFSVLQFSYDFAARILGVYTSGTVEGVVTDTLVAGEFALHLNDTNLMLNQLKIQSFGDISVQLKSNAVVGWISEPFLRTVTRLFRSRLTTTISDGVQNYTQRLLDDVNANDRLHIKNYVQYVIPILNTRSKQQHQSKAEASPAAGGA